MPVPPCYWRCYGDRMPPYVGPYWLCLGAVLTLDGVVCTNGSLSQVFFSYADAIPPNVYIVCFVRRQPPLPLLLLPVVACYIDMLHITLHRIGLTYKKNLYHTSYL